MGYFRDWNYVRQSLELVHFFTSHDGERRKGVENIRGLDVDALVEKTF